MRIPEYPWLKLVGVRNATKGEASIGITGVAQIWEAEIPSKCVLPIVAPDNAYNALDLSTLKIPDGYEIDGASAEEAFGEVGPGDIGLHSSKTEAVAYYGAPMGPDTRRIRLRKIAQKTRTWVVVESCDPIVIEAWKREYEGSRHAPRVALKFEERPL